MAVPSVRRLAIRVILVLSATVVLLTMTSSSAFAKITEDDIGCVGGADITPKGGGKTVHVAAKDAEATVPREGKVRWRGATDEAVHNHSGEIAVDLGLGSIPIDDWGSENKKDEIEKAGTKKLPSVLKYLPPGTYLVTGSHEGDEGSCSGEIEITLEGGAELLWKAGGILLTLLAALGFISAGRPGA